LVTEAGGLVGNFTGESEFLEQNECLAGNPRVYGQLVGLLGKYSKFASAGDKAAVRQATQTMTRGEAVPAAVTQLDAADTVDSAKPDAPF
jgi:myo-inositol-1(or 4)-monophosphatase